MPVFKNDGERSDPGKYHPIQAFFLLLVRSVSLLLMIAFSLRFNFRAFRYTAENLTVLSELIYNSLDAVGETRAIALWHARLLHEQKAYGVVGPI